MHNLLAKTRAINNLVLKSVGHAVDFNIVSSVLSKHIEASIYILDQRGKVLGYSYLEDWVCDIMREIVEGRGGFPEEYNENLMKINETTANFSQVGNACVFSEKPCRFNNKITTMVPIAGPGSRLGTLVLARFGSYFTDEDLILGEYAATVVALEILRSRAKKIEEDARSRAAVQIALATLSYSELDAIQNIFEQLGGDEGLLVASKIADRVGITRSVIVNALRKFESAGVIESKSLGMKGTYIRVLNDHLLEELEKLSAMKK
ncbi:MAG: GTP-sensing transcriptional pleiotropic repressor CodY [Pelotomaculum sp. PtaB.Bin013]|uniref:Global transcriptional regulator CodY n=1 Tax=Pelotomaculum isophthalicicum JI TaxID=947010 RepID=A0A9X4GXZ1_9FIRM|nr:GTP-sensing pleiotropic transcriptional regulator CodY [Pelotomaculum isophthalicicum]MDF9407267.1 GTP-sensing pleiotropic transcriptional regulator CodY [Pelotomaculum isophthalicicum JI]OPX91969.1 MAG: GTP-sensing transcriptional pleiotropic repressor CodY [Pelotomaculum sp. PtaB.Bin013]